MLHGVPWLGVCAVSLESQVLLGPARSTVIAVIWAYCTLARNPFISWEALALAGGTIAGTSVGALSPRVKIISVHDLSNPREVLRARAKRAIRSSPLGLTIKTSVALAVVVELASSVTGALVLAHACAAMATNVPGILPADSPGFIVE
jgi:hypothetical protein